MLPLESISARINSPHRPPFMLLGSAGQFSTSRYGLGSWVCLGYGCACANSPNVAITAGTKIGVKLVRSVRIIANLFRQRVQRVDIPFGYDVLLKSPVGSLKYPA